MGLTREADVYIANVIKCRPPHNRNPEPAEVAQCRPYLQRQIELVQPDLILALGRFAAQALLAGAVPDADKLPLGKLRGQVYRVDGRPVVVSYHPAYLLRSPADKGKTWADLCLAMNALGYNPLDPTAEK
jgi:DNA polymerase